MGLKRAILTAVAALLCCLGLWGCGPGGWAEDSTGAPAATTTTTTSSSGTGPISSATVAQGPAVGETLSFSSFGTDDTDPISLAAGSYTVYLNNFGTQAASLAYYDKVVSTNFGVLMTNVTGNIQSKADVTLSGSVYYFHVVANGDWTVAVQHNS